MVGILTFHRGPNYGGFLQAWHMREAIRSLGHEATVINYQTPEHFAAERPKIPSLTLGAVKGFALNTLKARPFANPVAELSDHALETDPSRIAWNRFSNVVVGADVVWDFSSPHFGHDPVFFGVHPSQATTRFVAFAPSCGQAPVEGPLPKHISEGLKRFSSIQVRDETTAGLVERVTGSHPPIVVDPTWLQADADRSFKNRPKKPYALVYGLGAKGRRATALKAYCKQRGLLLVSAASPCETADKFYLSLGPFEWVDLFRHAECVITSTFHGLLYAIKYNKPLVFMERGPSRSKARIAIERCGVQDRVVAENQQFTPEHLELCLSQNSGCMIPEDWRQSSLQAMRDSLVV
jgi:hypothetical protein